MKRSVFLSLLLTAVVVSVTALVLVGCEDMTATGVTATPLSLSTTSSSLPTLVSGEMVGSTTTLSGTPGGAAPPSGTPGGAAPPTGTPAVATTTTAASVELGEPPLEPTLTRYEEDDPRLAWAGTWSVTGSPEDSGGSCRFAEYAGSSMKVYFSGVSISFITRIGPAVGIATVTLDGGPVTIDLYSPTWGYQKEVWSSGSLAPGSHTLKIEMPGDSNPASASKGIYVDAFAVTGTLE
jgi:hypothetical protein